MDHRFDPRNVFTAMHHKVTGELLHLMDGFYSNIEDGLFELAYRNDNDAQRKHCFDLMREMRYRRGNLIQTFAKRMQRSVDGWFDEDVRQENIPPELDALAIRMAEKCNAHFHVLLRTIAERTAFGTDREPGSVRLPISPYCISRNFVMSCQSLEFDKYAIEIVQDLFARFVLDRLGGLYGDCNHRLEEAGFYTIEELDIVSTA